MAAFTITSETRSVRSSAQYLFSFLGDFANFGAILPADKVQDFNHAGDQCSFVIKGITPMTVRLIEKVPCKYMLYASEGMGKFSFRLRVVFGEEPGTADTCRVELEGDLNPFIKSMAEKPLLGLVNTMAQKLSEISTEPGTEF